MFLKNPNANCNCCDNRECPLVKKSIYKKLPIQQDCSIHVPPKSGFPFIELALNHPYNLYKVFHKLNLKVSTYI